MIKRLARIAAFIVGFIMVIPCIIQWIISGENLGSKLMHWAVTEIYDENE